jgi:hypothetical protein
MLRNADQWLLHRCSGKKLSHYFEPRSFLGIALNVAHQFLLLRLGEFRKFQLGV